MTKPDLTLPLAGAVRELSRSPHSCEGFLASGRRVLTTAAPTGLGGELRGGGIRPRRLDGYTVDGFAIPPLLVASPAKFHWMEFVHSWSSTEACPRFGRVPVVDSQIGQGRSFSVLPERPSVRNAAVRNAEDPRSGMPVRNAQSGMPECPRRVAGVATSQQAEHATALRRSEPTSIQSVWLHLSNEVGQRIGDLTSLARRLDTSQ